MRLGTTFAFQKHWVVPASGIAQDRSDQHESTERCDRRYRAPKLLHTAKKEQEQEQEHEVVVDQGAHQ